MRWFLFVLLITLGCASPVPRERHPPPIVEHDDFPAGNEGSSVSVSMPADTFAEIAGWIGSDNVITLEKPIHVEKDNVTVDAPAGTRVEYQMGDESGTFTFDKPFPTVKAGIARMIGGVALHAVTINSDGTGVAKITGGYPYKFTWLDSPTASNPQTPCPCGCGLTDCDCLRSNAAVGAASTKPVMTIYAADWCGLCKKSKAECDAAEKLGTSPFHAELEERHPQWVKDIGSLPVYSWIGKDGKPYTRVDPSTKKPIGEYVSHEALVQLWKQSQK